MNVLKKIIFILIILYFNFCWARSTKEAFLIEGTIGQLAGSSVYSLSEEKYEPSGLASYLRFHIPLYQTKTFRFRFALANQFLDSKTSSPLDSQQVYFLTSAGFGAGFNAEWRFLKVGVEYQQFALRQIAVGTTSTQKNYTLTAPTYYFGLIYRFGALGTGITYQVKKATIPAADSGLSRDYDYEEKSTSLSLIYYFKGSISKFFRSLFR